MLETIVKQEIIFYVMGGLMLLGVLAKAVSHFTVRKMVKEAGEIHKSNHRLMRLLKAKFEHASMVSDRVQNVEAFVNKYIYEYRVMGMRLGAWRTFPKKILWLTFVLGVFAGFECYRMQGLGALTVKYIQWTGIFVLLLLLLGFLADEGPGLAVVKNYAVEYLENVCVHRYAKANQMVEEPEEEEEPAQEPIVEMEEEVAEEPQKSEQEMRIRAILEEFFA